MLVLCLLVVQEARAATAKARGCDAAWRGEVNITLASPLPSSRGAAASPAAGLPLTLSTCARCLLIMFVDIS